VVCTSHNKKWALPTIMGFYQIFNLSICEIFDFESWQHKNSGWPQDSKKAVTPKSPLFYKPNTKQKEEN
jgi:hypothetical protein